LFSKESGVRQAEIIAIGNEVVSGLIQDSNSRFLSARLQAVGADVSRITAVGDDRSLIRTVVQEALERVDIVIVTGGLGATHDDITKTVLADLYKSGFKKDEQVVAMLERFFKTRGQEVPQGVESQGSVPEAATILYNEKGTAPGLLFEKEGKMLYALPGVPLEMEYLFEKYIQPRLSLADGLKIWHRVLLTTGISEADLWSRIGSVQPLEKLVTVASLPSHLGVRIRLSVLAKEEEEAKARLDAADRLIDKKVATYLFGRDDETLEGKVGELLRKNKQTLAVAESCTGGLIGHRLTQVSGSSEYFLEGAVTYSNAAKHKRLGVAEELIVEYGAVSEEVALAMAEGVRVRAATDFGLAVTGIAGPTGGTEQKPVGLTFIAVSEAGHSECRKYSFHQDRGRNKDRAAQAALDLLRCRLIAGPVGE
jgi:competence/damage-inducible protein CinA-like protein